MLFFRPAREREGGGEREGEGEGGRERERERGGGEKDSEREMILLFRLVRDDYLKFYYLYYFNKSFQNWKFIYLRLFILNS